MIRGQVLEVLGDQTRDICISESDHENEPSEPR